MLISSALRTAPSTYFGVRPYNEYVMTRFGSEPPEPPPPLLLLLEEEEEEEALL